MHCLRMFTAIVFTIATANLQEAQSAPKPLSPSPDQPRETSSVTQPQSEPHNRPYTLLPAQIEQAVAQWNDQGQIEVRRFWIRVMNEANATDRNPGISKWQVVGTYSPEMITVQQADGTPIDKEDLPNRLEKQTQVLVADGAELSNQRLLKLYRPDTLVFILKQSVPPKTEPINEATADGPTHPALIPVIAIKKEIGIGITFSAKYHTTVAEQFQEKFVENGETKTRTGTRQRTKVITKDMEQTFPSSAIRAIDAQGNEIEALAFQHKLSQKTPVLFVYDYKLSDNPVDPWYLKLIQNESLVLIADKKPLPNAPPKAPRTPSANPNPSP